MKENIPFGLTLEAAAETSARSPSAKAEDGDALDILILMDEPAFVGCRVPPKLIGVIEAEQTEDGRLLETID